MNRKILWVFSALLLIIGFYFVIHSSIPVIVKEPYSVWTEQTQTYRIWDNNFTTKWPLYTTYTNRYVDFIQGDKLSIKAYSLDNQTSLSATVSKGLFNVVAEQENSLSINLEYTIPVTGTYEIKVSRFKTEFEIITSETSANVYSTAQMTKQVETQTYRDLATYPNKNFETAGFAILLFGIGIGILSIAKPKEKNLKI